MAQLNGSVVSLALVFFVVALCSAAKDPEPADKLPNVLIIVADDVGVDQLASYGLGSDLPYTPVLDSLAMGGVQFENAWSNPVCSTTRATILTGRYSFRTGMGFVPDPKVSFAIDSDEVFLPEALDDQGSGYSHAAFGKWHLPTTPDSPQLAPNAAGFSHYAGLLNNVTPPKSSYYRWRQTVDGVSAPTSGYLTTRTASDAANWINSTPEPWLCYVAFHSAHAPFHTPRAGTYSEDLSAAGNPATNPRPYYKAMVESVDYEIGQLLGAIGDVAKNTTVIFVGDNGTPKAVTVPPFDPLHAKATTFQGGIQVPLIVSGARVSEAGVGSVCNALVSTTDLFSTAVELAGVGAAFASKGHHGSAGSSASTGIDGISLVPYLRQPGTPSIRRTVFAEVFKPNGFGPLTVSRRTIRNQRYKYTANTPATQTPEDAAGEVLGVGAEELFDLLDDPFELVNLLDKPALTGLETDAYKSLKRALDRLLSN